MADHGKPNKPAYYQPYLASDSELSDEDSQTDTTSPPLTPRTDNSNEGDIEFPNFAELARGLRTVPLFERDTEGFFDQNFSPPDTTYTPFSTLVVSAPAPPPPTVTTNAPPAVGKDASVTSKVDTVVMLRSRDRDKGIFPQPTSCQLTLPRIYKNVSGFSIAQINLISAFFYFSQTKVNLAIKIYEQGSVLYETKLVPSLSNTSPRKITNSIREGSYNISQLLTELQIQLNKVPLFYDFLNGFSDFLQAFTVNGDYSVNFNYPGDYYYDALRQVYVPNPTRATIVSYYFQNQYANQFQYSLEQVQVAYYYPVIKEAFLDPDIILSEYNFSGTGLSQADTIDYLINSFQGLNDPITITFINLNFAQLDTYRLLHTFRYSLVNEYSCTYNPTNNRVIIQCQTLNNSLVNLLNAQYNSYLSHQLSLFGISAATYNTLANTNTQLLSIIQAMYDYLQIQFAQYFAINYGTYTRAYYGNTSNTVFIRNGLNAAGIYLQYTPGVTQAQIEIDIASGFRMNPPYYWPRMSNLAPTEGAQRNMGSTSDVYPQSSNYPYNLSLSNIDLTRNFIDSNGNIYTDVRRMAGDILVNVDDSKYTIFQFRSKYRQTLQIETLPRQTNWRYPLWNKGNNVPYPLSNLFDVSYCFVTPTSTMINHVTPFDISYNAIYGWSNLSNTSTNFGYNYTQSADKWSTFSEHINVANSNGRYYTFQTPLPLVGTSTVYTYPFNVTVQSYNSPTFPSDFYAFFYQDIAAFSADLSGVRHESPIHYKHVLDISANTLSSFTYSFNAYANQQYYILLRAVSITPSSTDYRIIPWFSSSNYSTLSYSIDFDPLQDPLTMLSNFNVAKEADPDFLRLPITPSTLWYYEPPRLSVNIPLSTQTVAIGYDSRGVSTDLTDYIPFSAYNTVSTIYPPATLCIDPTNNYIFQHNSDYNEISQSYFYSGSKNAILKPYAQAQYSPGTVKTRQYKMLNYYATNYIHDPPNIPIKYNSLTSTSQYISPYNISTTSNTPIPGYKYSLQGNLVLGAGNCGFMFIPGEGTWAIDRISFKSNFINPAASDNENIHALAVFITAEIYYQPISFMNLSNALAVCLRVGENFYQDSNTLNIGFDASLGTYYTFSNYPQLISRNLPISGLAQLSKVLIPDPNAYYSVVAYTFEDPEYVSWDSNAISTLLGNFKVNGNIFPSTSVYTIQNMTGSPIAYPYANKAFPSTVFYDGQETPNQRGVVLSTSNGNSTVFGPPTGYDESESQYEQSEPYLNTNMHFLSPLYIVNDSNGFEPWAQIPIRPNYVYASVSNYMMFQGTSFAIAKYVSYREINYNTPAARNFIYEAQLATEQIFPDSEDTILIGVSGNSQEYVFLGATPIVGNSNVNQLRFKVYDPARGILSELPTNPYYTFSNSLLLQNFVFNTSRQWYLTATNRVTNNVFLQGDTSYASNTNTLLSYTYSGNSVSELQMDPDGRFLYLAYHDGAGFSTMQMFSLDSNDPQYVRNNTVGYTIHLENGGSLPPTYRQISVMLNSRIGTEEVILTNTSYSSSNYYYLDFYNTLTANSSNAFLLTCAQTMTQTPFKIIGGAGGSKWNLTQTAPFIYGNRNDAYDAPISIDIAWQVFFPTMKIEMRQLTTGVTPIVDLTNLKYPEWPHTAMFAYSNYNTLINDISGVVGSNQGKWGQEANYNFFASDVSFNGFYFNSYMMSIPLLPNYNNGSYLTDYYIAVRGWLPTEQFQTMLRFYMPNEYDFGFLRFTDISNEVMFAASNSSEFNPTYLEALLSFNSNFTFSNQNFGSNTTQGLVGSNLTSCNFGDFMNQYQEYFSTFSTNTYILSNIQASVNDSINDFIVTNMQYILPSTAGTRQRFTDPLLFQILWKSQLGVNFVTLDDEWGLGWNLGYPKQDTGFATIQTGSSFYKITNDYIYLRLNPEFNMNRVDAGGKENYRTTREPTGITNEYYCKLLLTNFGGNATTFIHNPITFLPHLNRLTKLEFQWIDTAGIIINNNDSEWDMVVNISENLDIVPVPTLTMQIPQNLSFNPTIPPGTVVTVNSKSLP